MGYNKMRVKWIIDDHTFVTMEHGTYCRHHVVMADFQWVTWGLCARGAISKSLAIWKEWTLTTPSTSVMKKMPAAATKNSTQVYLLQEIHRTPDTLPKMLWTAMCLCKRQTTFHTMELSGQTLSMQKRLRNLTYLSLFFKAKKAQCQPLSMAFHKIGYVADHLHDRTLQSWDVL